MAISDGMTVGWTSPMIPYFLSENSHISMTRHQAEWLETWYPIGSMIGLPFTVFFVNKIGRKKSLLLGTFAMLIQWILIFAAPSINYIYAARIIGGMAGDMSFVAAPSYISEIADKNIRGFLSSIIFLLQMVGVIAIYVIGAYLPFYAASLTAGILLTIELILFSFLPETPYYLLSKDNREEAKKSLIKFRATASVDSELDEIHVAIEKQKLEKGKLTDIFLVKGYRKAILIIVVLDIAQQIGAINVVLMNLHIILEEAGSIYINPSKAAVLFSGLLFMAAVASSVVVDKFGRRKLLIVSNILTMLCLLIIGIYFSIKNGGYEYEKFSWLPVVCVMIYAVVYKIGLGMVPIVITAEIFASKIKALGMSIGNTVYTITAIGAIQIFTRLKDVSGMQYPFYIFAIGSLIATAVEMYYIPETKGKSLHEIQLLLEGKNKNKNDDNLKNEKEKEASF